jgi:hypothetical protein
VLAAGILALFAAPRQAFSNKSNIRSRKLNRPRHFVGRGFLFLMARCNGASSSRLSGARRSDGRVVLSRKSPDGFIASVPYIPALFARRITLRFLPHEREVKWPGCGWRLISAEPSRTS